MLLCSMSKIDAGLTTFLTCILQKVISSSLCFCTVPSCEGLGVLCGEDQLMGNGAFSLDLPSGPICRVAGSGKAA